MSGFEQLIEHPIILITCVVLIAIVVLVALWKGQMVDFFIKGLHLKYEQRSPQDDSAQAGISVLKDGKLKGSTAGDIGGVIGDEPGSDGSIGPINVGERAIIEDSHVGDIYGKKIDRGHRGRDNANEDKSNP